MNQRQMFEASFQRPKTFFSLSARRQWEIDEALGILDWAGDNLSAEDEKRFQQHYAEDEK